MNSQPALIAGLGHGPAELRHGRALSGTRHNAGHELVDLLATHLPHLNGTLRSHA